MITPQTEPRRPAADPMDDWIRTWAEYGQVELAAYLRMWDRFSTWCVQNHRSAS